jgi:Aerotolerance regulator N-terminal
MVFLQPWILFGLPLVLLPIAIHLLNQRRHRPIDWGAMHFLRQASRMHQGAARIRYWLILLLRLLAVACVLFFMSRPLATGWLSLVGNSASRVIVILDCSPSMEMTDTLHGRSKRASAIAKLDAMFEAQGNRSERILFVSSDKPPVIVPSNVKLADLAETQSSDVSAKIPELVSSAIRYVQAEGLGPTEVWCCSDLQANDWDTQSGLWPTIRETLAAFPFVRLTMLSYAEKEQFNAAVRVQRAALKRTDRTSELILDFSVRQTSGNLVPRVLPVTVQIGESRVVVELELSGREVVRNGFVVPIDSSIESGAGTIELPSDANAADNRFCFAFSKPTTMRSSIVTDDENVSRILRIMTKTSISKQPIECDLVSTQKLTSLKLDDVGLLIWQSPLPEGTIAEQIKQFVAAGGVVLFFPPSSEDNSKRDSAMFGMQWLNWSDVDSQEYSIQRWRREADLLRNAESGEVLPVDELQVRRMCAIAETGTIKLATFSSGASFLSKAPMDVGAVYFCSTLPTEESSNLADNGVVLYAMIQRALAEGCSSVSGVNNVVAGGVVPADLETWERVDMDDKTIVAADRPQHAAAYRSGNRLLVINRSAGEDDSTEVDEKLLKSLVAGGSARVLNDQIESDSGLTREVWRWFTFAAVFALIAEAFLTLPNKMGASKAFSIGSAPR